MVRNHFKIAWRNITRNKLYAGINVLGLALGICACIIIWLVSSFELSFDTFHPDKDRIYRVGSKMKILDWYDDDVPPPAPDAIRKEITGIETVTCFYPFSNAGITVPNGNKPAGKFDSEIEGRDGMPGVIIADSNWFAVFKYDWMAGSPGTSLHDPYRVVLSESRARQYFGDLPLNKIIGKELIYDDSLRVTVSGIVKQWNQNTDLPYSDFISFPTISSSFLKNKRLMTDWNLRKGGGLFYWPVSFVKLSKGVTETQVNAELVSLVARHIKTDSSNTFSMQLQPLGDIHFDSAYSHENIRKASLPALYGMMGIALFILLLAAVNFINLATAQSIQRAKEIGVRKVLGSSKNNLVFQFLIEALVLTGFAVVLAALLVNPFMNILHDYIPDGLRFRILAWPSVLFLVSITIVTTLLAGFYPARVLSGYMPIISLKGAGDLKGPEKWWLRKSLIVFQFSISLIFIIIAIIMSNQIRFMLFTDYGFNTAKILTVDADIREAPGKIDVFQQRIKELPGINQIVRQGNVPIGWGMSFASVIYKGKNVIKPIITMDWGNEEFVPFYQMHLLAGRNIRPSDSLVEWVINETFAKNLGFNRAEQAIGQFLYWNNKPIPIVGIVSDFHEASFREAIKPLIIGHDPRFERSLGIKLSGNTKSTLGGIEKIFKELYPKNSFRYLFMDQSIASLYDEEQKTAALMKGCMLLTVFISCMGLFGLSLFTASRRTKEIGIRKVLGARVTDIVSMLSRDFVFLVILSLCIASPIAWFAMHRWLEDFAYRVPVDWWVFPAAGISAIGIALLTIGYQAIRAAIANPAKSLRAE